jgi:putative SOS response-associated peptidase YedK
MPAAGMQLPNEVLPFRWGLIPAFIKSAAAAKEISNKTLNAKCETIFDLPSYKSSIIGNRCIIFVSGFFEWQHTGKQKIPHYISLPGHIMALGGVASSWVDPQTGEIIDTCSIITTPANSLMAMIHNKGQRMPLILPPALWDNWLEHSSGPPAISKLMQPYPFSDLHAEQVITIAPPGSQTGNANYPHQQTLF